MTLELVPFISITVSIFAIISFFIGRVSENNKNVAKNAVIEERVIVISQSLDHAHSKIRELTERVNSSNLMIAKIETTLEALLRGIEDVRDRIKIMEEKKDK